MYWLELIIDGGLLAKEKIAPLFREANELTAIFTAARRSSTVNKTLNVKPQT
ncbi:MAG: hypothetical protein ABJB32_05840 [Verrucomicrobiota bacterium]